VGAERIGDPAILYVGMVHPEGPAHKAGLRHGDEIVSVDGTTVTGKSFEQVVKMIRGEAGTVVKVGVKDEKGLHELSVERVTGDALPKGPAGSHGYR
jgi:C-terminal processing protease CtpA/Prc